MAKIKLLGVVSYHHPLADNNGGLYALAGLKFLVPAK